MTDFQWFNKPEKIVQTEDNFNFDVVTGTDFWNNPESLE
jgi:regulation of enolase protein 1 (concanavalin A-like superfamily)